MQRPSRMWPNKSATNYVVTKTGQARQNVCTLWNAMCSVHNNCQQYMRLYVAFHKVFHPFIILHLSKGIWGRVYSTESGLLYILVQSPPTWQCCLYQRPPRQTSNTYHNHCHISLCIWHFVVYTTDLSSSWTTSKALVSVCVVLLALGALYSIDPNPFQHARTHRSVNFSKPIMIP